MNRNFRIVMNMVDDDLLEEAIKPVKRKQYRLWLGTAAAACLLLALALPMLQPPEAALTLGELSDMGYEMALPETADNIRYEIVTLANRECVQASFSIRETDYVYRAEKTSEPRQLSEDCEADAQLLSWNADALDIQLLSTSESTAVSWYTREDQTQWYLTASADPLEVLTTASQILRATGLNVTVAPDTAEEITYNAFSYHDLTVAETTFMIDGISYSFRMAATTELLEDFADISGMDGHFEQIEAGEISWCRAKLSFTEGGQGKIIWFDLVPGILYSLSMDSGASGEALLDMAHQLFEPAQGNS